MGCFGSLLSGIKDQSESPPRPGRPLGPAVPIRTLMGRLTVQALLLGCFLGPAQHGIFQGVFAWGVVREEHGVMARQQRTLISHSYGVRRPTTQASASWASAE